MSKAQYNLYIGKVFDLARSLIVKSEITARTINAELTLLGKHVIPDQPATWRYYLNLNGQYHSADKMMTVTSLDNHQTIEFTKENLRRHHATAREYREYGAFYKALVSRFPEQELLIRGVLNPVDLSAAIKAADGQILHHNADLVEENETNLIPLLDAWSQRYFVRWQVQDYCLTDDLYAAGFLAVYYQQLPQKIINYRLGNCHTRFAHSFHIRQFLASHGKLDRFVDYLTKEQTLWLYRNIRYIERNVGKQDTFDWLIENILTKRSIPIAEWSVRHALEYMPTDLVPSVAFERKPLNLGVTSVGRDVRDVPTMVTAELKLARSNEEHYWESVNEITEKVSNSMNDHLRTKVLESSLVDATDALPFTLADTLLNHWLYLASTDRYTALISIESPRTGGRLTFTPKEAYAVFLYAFIGARGQRLPFVPDMVANHVLRPILPTEQELWSIADREYFPSALMDAIMADVEPLGNQYISIDGFSDKADRIHQQKLKHRFLYGTREHYITRGLAEQVSQRYYANIQCRLYNEQSYLSFFEERGLDIDKFNELELDILWQELLKSATGQSLRKVKSLKEIQEALLALVMQLSSYSIQIIQDINTNPIKIADWSLIRFGWINAKAEGHHSYEIVNVTVKDLHSRARSHYADLQRLIGPEYQLNSRLFSSRSGQFDIDIKIDGKTNYYARYPLQTIQIQSAIQHESVLGVDTPIVDTNEYVPTGTGYPLVEAFDSLQSPHMSLTTSERRLLQRRWEIYRYPERWTITDWELIGLNNPDTGPLDQNLNGLDNPETGILNPVLNGLNSPDTSPLDPLLNGPNVP